MQLFDDDAINQLAICNELPVMSVNIKFYAITGSLCTRNAWMTEVAMLSSNYRWQNSSIIDPVYGGSCSAALSLFIRFRLSSLLSLRIMTNMTMHTSKYFTFSSISSKYSTRADLTFQPLRDSKYFREINKYCKIKCVAQNMQTT